MADIHYILAETDLASRQAAARFRAVVEERALVSDRVAIDLSAVLSLSESYADELFGVLVARYGLEWFAGHVSVHGAKPAVFRSIANAIRYRLEAAAPGKPDIALLAARQVLQSQRSSV